MSRTTYYYLQIVSWVHSLISSSPFPLSFWTLQIFPSINPLKKVCPNVPFCQINLTFLLWFFIRPNGIVPFRSPILVNLVVYDTLPYLIENISRPSVEQFYCSAVLPLELRSRTDLVVLICDLCWLMIFGASETGLFWSRTLKQSVAPQSDHWDI